MSSSNDSTEAKVIAEENKSLDGLVSWLLDNGAVINKVVEKKIQGQLFSIIIPDKRIWKRSHYNWAH